MSQPSTTYLFLEVAVFCFFLGVCWEEFRSMKFSDRRIWKVVLALAVCWFVVDEVAVLLGLWTFPPGSTLPIRLVSLPPEEYLLFFLHTFLCLALLRHFSFTRR